MADSVNQFAELIKTLPLAKKISILFVVLLVITGFGFMFFLANQEDYQVLFNNLTPEDGGAIVSKLQERRIPYKLEANGTVVMVPAQNVYELRLSLAGEGLPQGGQVGFEIFDQTNFGATKFVQELNYQRALQGELARTINQFKEVNSSRVFIVLPKQSLFVEAEKPASASIQLDLRSNLPPSKLAAIVHLVANAVEGLDPEQITVVDTKGRLIFKGKSRNDTDSTLSNTQLEYKQSVENGIRDNIETLLEGIVGTGRAIVRVTAEIDFNKMTLNEEEFDPDSTAVRSKRSVEESVQSGNSAKAAEKENVNQRRGVMPSDSNENQNQRTKRDSLENYEINRITRTILKPAGSIQRLSVAAVIDGTYRALKQEDGSIKREYVPRSPEELRQFEEIVKKAMGFSDDREDQVTVTSLSFADAEGPSIMAPGEEGSFDLLRYVGGFRKPLLNILLLLLVVFLVVRPLLKSLRQVGGNVVIERQELPDVAVEIDNSPINRGVTQKEQVLKISESNPEKAQQLIKGWIGEHE